ncbi:MAG TPA: Ig-like domain-containing protein [Candidatus Sulfotelmatobacter sp.]|nr:Ig-like domain-containing protein [Candidatus Sulfotelmatobacter sp.]
MTAFTSAHSCFAQPNKPINYVFTGTMTPSATFTNNGFFWNEYSISITQVEPSSSYPGFLQPGDSISGTLSFANGGTCSITNLSGPDSTSPITGVDLDFTYSGVTQGNPPPQIYFVFGLEMLGVSGNFTGINPSLGSTPATEALGGVSAYMGNVTTTTVSFNGLSFGVTNANGVVVRFSPPQYVLCYSKLPAPSPVTITPLRVSHAQADISFVDSIDDPIVPVTDTNKLGDSQIPLGLGLVADGVTPVLFQITGKPGTYAISLTNSSINYNPFFYTNIFVMQDGAWINSTNLTIPGSSPDETNVTYAYMQGLDWGQFFKAPPYQPVMLKLSVTSPGAAAASSTFEIRPPPIVLVHGYDASAVSWTPSFLTNLYAFEPADFVFPINYGTNNDNSENTTEPLDYLAQVLDTILVGNVENALTNWAFTRYDVVGHSQGGVLTRMLCEQLPSGLAAFGNAGIDSTPVISQKNFYRGRFRRVITLNSPQNGSVLLHYVLDMKKSLNPLNQLIPFVMGSHVQPKFDPFGPQIAEINDPNLSVDSRLKFVCIQTTINSGKPPSVWNTLPIGYVSIPCYGAIGLETLAGAVVLPNGSDGVVDFEGQCGGVGTTNRYISSPDIAHADSTSLNGNFELFGVPPQQSDTTYPLVAQNVIALLDGPASFFGPFKIPQLLSSQRESEIDDVVPVVSAAGVIDAGLASLVVIKAKQKPVPKDQTGGITNFTYSLQLPENVAGSGHTTWFAQVFGPNGISPDGVDLTVNGTNSTEVTVSVTNNIVGTVVLYATYTATNGNIVVASPVVVLSSPPGTTLSGIQMQPASMIMAVGDAQPLSLLGQYAGGTSSILYLTNNQATFISSNPSIASVDDSGDVTLNSFGSTTITASYGGFSAQAVVSSESPSITGLSAVLTTNGVFQVEFMGTPGSTNIIEASTNLFNWTPLAALSNTNGFIEYQDTLQSNYPRRFYRVEIPASAP